MGGLAAKARAQAALAARERRPISMVVTPVLCLAHLPEAQAEARADLTVLAAMEALHPVPERGALGRVVAVRAVEEMAALAR